MAACVMAAPLATRSTLELMLDSIQRRDEQPPDFLPALPARPTSRARLPSSRRSLPRGLKSIGDSPGCLDERESGKENRPSREDKGDSFNNRIVGSSHDGKVNALVDADNRTLQGIVSVQKHFRGLQARLYYQELKGGVITLQSFVRGERSRCQYNFLIKRSRAAALIQKHVRRWIAEQKFHNHRKNVILLQSVIHGWLARKHFSAMKSLKQINHIQVEVNKGAESNFQKIKDSIVVYRQLHHSILAELQIRILRAEAALRQKEEENAILRKQLQQYEARWSEYEIEVKSMEEMWQRKMASLHMNLAVTKSSLVADVKSPPGKLNASPIYPLSESEDYPSSKTCTPEGTPVSARTSDGMVTAASLIKEFEKQKEGFEDDAEFIVKVKSGQPASGIKPGEEVWRVKGRFAAWKKDFKVRLRDTNTALKKLVGCGAKKTGKKQWGKECDKALKCFI